MKGMTNSQLDSLLASIQKMVELTVEKLVDDKDLANKVKKEIIKNLDDLKTKK